VQEGAQKLLIYMDEKS